MLMVSGFEPYSRLVPLTQRILIEMKTESF